MSIWNTIKKYAGQLGFIYNQAGKKYNEPGITYGGKITTAWINRTPKN